MFRYTFPSFIYPIFPSLTWKIKTTEPVVYLTFDDGPHPDITPWVLSLLNQFQARATFFCVGDNVRKFPETYQQVLESGHVTGNHTFHHLKGWTVSDKEYLADVALCAQYVNSRLFRPPYGRIHLSQINRLKSDYKIIMWSILTRDFEKNLNPEAALRAIKKAMTPGSIIVMHDSIKARTNLEYLLPNILEYGRINGFRFESLTA